MSGPSDADTDVGIADDPLFIAANDRLAAARERELQLERDQVEIEEKISAGLRR